MKPSDISSKYPWASTAQNSESETVAQNIVTILKRTGDVWRKLEYEEYEMERKKDGNYSSRERGYFDSIVDYTVSAEMARAFSPEWNFKPFQNTPPAAQP